MTMDSINDKELIFNMELLPGELHGLGNIEGQMSLFVDSAEEKVLAVTAGAAMEVELEVATAGW